jgi:hypothetical protein
MSSTVLATPCGECKDITKALMLMWLWFDRAGVATTSAVSKRRGIQTSSAGVQGSTNTVKCALKSSLLIY